VITCTANDKLHKLTLASEKHVNHPQHWIVNSSSILHLKRVWLITASDRIVSDHRGIGYNGYNTVPQTPRCSLLCVLRATSWKWWPAGRHFHDVALQDEDERSFRKWQNVSTRIAQHSSPLALTYYCTSRLKTSSTVLTPSVDPK